MRQRIGPSMRRLHTVLVVMLAGTVVACSGGAAPQPPAAKNRTLIQLPDAIGGITYSARSNKLYLSRGFGSGTLVVSLLSPAAPPAQLDRSIDLGARRIVVNNKLALGYVLTTDGTVRLFNTDNTTLVGTTPRPACHAVVLAVNESTGTVYGGGMSGSGECLVEIDSTGHIVRDDVVVQTPGANKIIQRMAVDPASGDVVYADRSSLARADASLVEKWRSPVAASPIPTDMGFEPRTGVVYLAVGGSNVAAPASVYLYDGRTGTQQGQFTAPGASSGFASDRAGHVFAAFFNSTDLYVLTDGGTALTKFASLADIGGLRSSDVKFLALDPTGHRLFVSPAGHNVYIYGY
jgi:hypothetical protein